MIAVNDDHNPCKLKIFESGISLPPLPGAGSQLLAFSQQPINEIDVTAFAKLVESDPALCAKVLQLANSSYYGTINKIISLRQAIMHIGLEEMLNAVYLFFCQNSLPKLPIMEGFSGKDYWAHSWACAIANRMLGRPDFLIKTLPGELYIAGLLHGIGKLILAIYRPDDFLQCIRNSREFGQPLAIAEKEIFGTTDSQIAYEIMKSWNLPTNICAAAKFYQTPELADPEFIEIASLTQFAYFIANTSGIGNSGDEFCYDLTQTWIAKDVNSSLTEVFSQKNLIKDIYSTLHKKTLNITGVEPDKNAILTEEKQTVANQHENNISTCQNSKKNTLFRRIMSFFKF